MSSLIACGRDLRSSRRSGTSAACNGTSSVRAHGGRCGRSIGPAAPTALPAGMNGSQKVAYASQFLDPMDRAKRTKARLLGNADPKLWDLPPKRKGMHWRTYER